MSVLHIINRSPFESCALESCLRLIQPGDSVLLIEDAVVAAVGSSAFSQRLIQPVAAVVIYALVPDLRARGLAEVELAAGIELVDYSGFVDLTVAHDSSLSWS